MEDIKPKKRARDDSELETDSPEVKRLREDLLYNLDDDTEFCSASQDLDSFMKSFEEEITASGGDVADLKSDSGESGPDLGYLLEASDDELGLPPTASSPGGLESEDRIRLESDSSELGSGFWEVSGYDSFEFGFSESETDYSNSGVGEYVALDGLFDHSDLAFGSGDFAYRPETLPAQ